MLTTQAIAEGIEETISGVDFVEQHDDGTVTFTIMLGGVNDEEWAATERDIDAFRSQYPVVVEPTSGGPSQTTYEVRPEGH
jgi:hypothetical protein